MFIYNKAFKDNTERRIMYREDGFSLGSDADSLKNNGGNVVFVNAG